MFKQGGMAKWNPEKARATRVPKDKVGAVWLLLEQHGDPERNITTTCTSAEAFITALYAFHADKAAYLGLPFDNYVAEKVALKAREFNSRVNNPDQEAQRLAREKAKAVRAYRKASDGD